MSRRYSVILLLVLAVGAIAGWAARGFIAVDACLDAGGQWVDRGGYCLGARAGG